MHPRLRQFLHRRNIAVGRFHWTVEARRARIFTAYGADVVFDIGANVGQYGSVLRQAGYAGRIVSFEPVAAAFARLSDRAATDPGWETNQLAVAAEPGSLTMNVTDHLSFSSPLAPRREYADLLSGEAAPVRTETVAAETLDVLAERHTRAHNGLAVKMDVQGFEGQVLDGGEQTIRRAVALELELALIPSYEGESLAPALLERMFRYGFRLALVENVLQDSAGCAIAINGLFVREQP